MGIVFEPSGHIALHSSDAEAVWDDEAASAYLLRTCIVWPGVLHILHNAAHHLTGSLEHFDEFEKSLTGLNRLLHNR